MRELSFHQKLRRWSGVVVVSAVTALTVVLAPSVAHATVTPSGPAGQVSFTFDDGFESFITKSAPTLSAHGIKGTAYITTGFMDQPTYMTWAQVTQLKNQYGWEIASHSVSHPLMTEITPAQMEQEAVNSKQELQSHGFNPTNYATPFGDYSPAVEAAIAKHYQSHRGFHDIGYNTWPYNRYLLQVQQVQGGVSVATVKGYIDQAKANNTWLILVFHDVKDNPSTDPEAYEYSPADLNEIAAYAKAQDVATPTVAEALPVGTGGQLPATNLNNGWSTDKPANVTNDTAGNGNDPNPNDSVKMTADATSNTHLFSPTITVDPTQQYWVSGYANIIARQNGVLGVYIDEYDANNTWISGQYKQEIANLEVKDISFIYIATSSGVAKIRIQLILTANSGITAFVDNVQLYAIAGTGPDPDPGPTDPTNVMPNSQFDNGLTGGWTTDNPTAITADTTGNGSPSGTQNAIKLVATTANAHLFAPQINVTPSSPYTVKAYLNVVSLTSGEVAFYIDEYDANGAWVSGQYIYAKRNAGVENVSFVYTPTSANVAKAGLQVILQGGSGITAYLDDVQWLAQGGTPPPDPGPGPAPTPTVLLTTTFENGIADGWHTDQPTVILADAAGNGATDEAAHSVKLTSTTVNAHLFSSQVTVAPATAYSLLGFLNVTALTSGEIAFYIDEYDAAGNWVSGQYLHARRAVGTENVNIAYTATSANVAKAALQVIVQANSGITGYLDSVKWQTA